MLELTNELLISALVLILLASCLSLCPLLSAEIERKKISTVAKRIAEIFALIGNLEGASLELELPQTICMRVVEGKIKIGEGTFSLYVRIPAGVEVSSHAGKIFITKT